MKRIISLLFNIIILFCILQVSPSCQKQDYAANINPLIDKYLDVWNTGDLKELDVITTSEFELRMTPDFEPKIGRNLLKEEIYNTRTAFPDFHLKVDERFFVGDSAVVICWTLTGKNTGKSSIPPTGNEVNIQGFSVIFFVNKLITGEWIAYSDLAWVTQLGFILTPPEFTEN